MKKKILIRTLAITLLSTATLAILSSIVDNTKKKPEPSEV